MDQNTMKKTGKITDKKLALLLDLEIQLKKKRKLENDARDIEDKTRYVDEEIELLTNDLYLDD